MMLTQPTKAYFDSKNLWKTFLRSTKSSNQIPKTLFLNPFPGTSLVFGIKTRKTPPEHFWGCKMQSTCRMNMIFALIGRYDTNTTYKSISRVEETCEKNLEVNKVK